jgi:hypothetical protein
MRGMSIKRKATCKTSVSVKVNGIFKFSGAVKIWGFDSFGTSKSRGGGYRVSHCRTLKMFRKQSVGVMTLAEIASVRTTNRKVKIQNFKVSMYWNVSKFTYDQSK